ncbi:HNH endonuclease signature motif containing protein [Tessaracoccus aquimaris]|nr:HNH endonuclease signature motif containing protein [Tessaracoccus aquimaris]
MEAMAREQAEAIRSAVTCRRRAEADLLASICELAECYRVDTDELLAVLAEKRIRVGAEGTPLVSEFLSLELAGLLECSPHAAGHRLIEALNLKHRHPKLFAAVVELKVEASRAVKAAARCAHLRPEVAEAVTLRWLPRQDALGWTATFNLLDKLIIEADRAAAQERERLAREDRGVHVWGLFDGCMNLTGRLDVLDARSLDVTATRVARLLEDRFPGLTLQQRRAKALGILANPAQALALLQSGDQPTLPGDPEHHEAARPRPSKVYRPELGLAVHIHADSVGGLPPAARVDKAGWITSRLLGELLGEAKVTVHPVIDLADLDPSDGYEPGAQLKRAVEIVMPTEMFPYSNRSSRRLDLDHTVPWREGYRAQTRLGNLVPLNRRAHRAKTARAWKSLQRGPDVLVWESPLGYRYELTPCGTWPLRE